MYRTSLLVLGFINLALPLRAAELDLKYLSDDAHLVVTINVRKTLETPAYKKQFAQPIEALLKMEIVQAILKDTGFDPLKDIDRVTMAADNLGDMAAPLFIVQGRFDAAKLEAKAKQFFKDLKIREAGAYKVYDLFGDTAAQSGLETVRFVAIADGHTMAICRSKERVIELLDKAAGKRKTQFKDKNLAALLRKLDADQAVSLAATGDLLGHGEGSIKDTAGIDALFGYIRIADDVKGEATVVAADAAKAKAMADRIQEYLQKGIREVKREIEDPKPQFPARLMAPFLNVLNAIKVSTQDNTAIIKGDTSAETLVRFVQSFVAIIALESAPPLPDDN